VEYFVSWLDAALALDRLLAFPWDCCACQLRTAEIQRLRPYDALKPDAHQCRPREGHMVQLRPFETHVLQCRAAKVRVKNLRSIEVGPFYYRAFEAAAYYFAVFESE